MSASEPFDYNDLDLETQSVIKQHTEEIKQHIIELNSLMRRAVETAIEIGQKLIDVREKLRGRFVNWLDSEFGSGKSTAYKCINLAELAKNSTDFLKLLEFPQYGNSSQNPISLSAAYLCAKRSTPEKARQEIFNRAKEGKKVTHSIAKEIIAKYKSKDATNHNDEQLINPDNPPKTPATEKTQLRDETTPATSAPDSTEKGVQTEKELLSSQESLPDSAFEDKQIKDTPDNTTQTPTQALANFHSNYSGDMALAADKGNYLPKDQTGIEAKPVTILVAAKTVQTSSTSSAKPESAQYTKPSKSLIDETAIDSLSSVVDSASTAETVLADSASANQTCDMALAADKGDYLPKDQTEIKIQSLFEVGNLICITAFGQQDHKWLGEVVEFKSATATSTEVVVRIRPATGQRLALCSSTLEFYSRPTQFSVHR